MSGGNTQFGMIKMAADVDLDWIKDKMSKLKEIDSEELCGVKKKDEEKVIGKRVQREE